MSGLASCDAASSGPVEVQVWADSHTPMSATRVSRPSVRDAAKGTLGSKQTSDAAQHSLNLGRGWLHDRPIAAVRHPAAMLHLESVFPPFAAHAKGHCRTGKAHLCGVEAFDDHETSRVAFKVAHISDATARENRHTDLTGLDFTWSVWSIPLPPEHLVF